MDKTKKSLTPIGDIISEILGSGLLPFNPDDTRIWKVWEEVVGQPIAAHAKPLRIKQKRLRVRVSDPIWYQELTFMAEDIRERLNGILGRNAIEKIEFCVGGRND